ncbi:hypothetical protein ACQP2P_18870 [Dactylosporangium sp. CA-139114]|uniref:hypothetical protein n=1 Tax=Dactylosporangium sp. CA-139114 TaxID=3239931 RepID=UPI003D95E94A
MRVRDRGTGQVRHALSDHDDPVLAVACSPGGSLLASGCAHPRRDVFDAHPGGPATLAVHPCAHRGRARRRPAPVRPGRRGVERAALHAVAYHADGSALATGDDAHVVLPH